MFCEFGNELERDRETIKGLSSFFNRVLLQCGKKYYILLSFVDFKNIRNFALYFPLFSQESDTE